MDVVDTVVRHLRDAGFADVYPNQLPSGVGEGIVVRLAASSVRSFYMDGSMVEEVTYQAICRMRSGAESMRIASSLIGRLSDIPIAFKKAAIISHSPSMHPQQLQVSESGYYETMVQFSAELMTR